jgi:hypothetical protein
MKTFKPQIAQAIKNKSLVELHLVGIKGYHVGIILLWFPKFFLYAKIDTNKKCNEIVLLSTQEVIMVRFHSLYLDKFIKKINYPKIQSWIEQKTGKLIRDYNKVDMTFMDLTDWLVGKPITVSYMFRNDKVVDGIVESVDSNNYVTLNGKKEVSVFKVDDVAEMWLT